MVGRGSQYIEWTNLNIALIDTFVYKGTFIIGAGCVCKGDEMRSEVKMIVNNCHPQLWEVGACWGGSQSSAEMVMLAGEPDIA